MNKRKQIVKLVEKKTDPDWRRVHSRMFLIMQDKSHDNSEKATF